MHVQLGAPGFVPAEALAQAHDVPAEPHGFPSALDAPVHVHSPLGAQDAPPSGPDAPVHVHSPLEESGASPGAACDFVQQPAAESDVSPSGACDFVQQAAAGWDVIPAACCAHWSWAPLYAPVPLPVHWARVTARDVLLPPGAH